MLHGNILWYSVGSQIGTSKLIDCRWPAASFTSSRDQSTIAVINRYNHLESNQISYWSSILRLKDFLHTGTRPLRDLSSPLSWFIHRQQFWLRKQNSFIFILSLQPSTIPLPTLTFFFLSPSPLPNFLSGCFLSLHSLHIQCFS